VNRGATAATVVATGAGWRVVDIVCTHGMHGHPFEERQRAASISLVLSGVFVYRSDHGSSLMSAGALVLGNAGQTFECSHRHGEGDRCLSFQFDPELFDRLAHEAGASCPAFDRDRLPPLRALAPVTGRARTAMERQDALEEMALDLAGAVVALAARPRRGSPATARLRSHRAGPAPAGSEQRGASHPGRVGTERGRQPVPLPAHLPERDRRDAAPMVAPRATPGGGAPPGHDADAGHEHRARGRLRGPVELHPELPCRVRGVGEPLSRHGTTEAILRGR
jgi:hypothetical protein